MSSRMSAGIPTWLLAGQQHQGEVGGGTAAGSAERWRHLATKLGPSLAAITMATYDRTCRALASARTTRSDLGAWQSVGLAGTAPGV